MFCYQCEQTSRGQGCQGNQGVCGKDARTAALQDLLTEITKGTAMYAHRARSLGGPEARDGEVDLGVVEALFSTVTNVNFDPQRVSALIDRMAALRERARELYRRECERAGRTPETLGGAAALVPTPDLEGRVKQGEAAAIPTRQAAAGNDAVGLQELILYGLKGMAAYADHASLLGREDPSLYAFFHEALDAITRLSSVPDLLALALKVGEWNLKTMELLDAAHTGTFGHPSPTAVRVTPRKGKAILVSGHDLLDLSALLEQTAGTGINVYTHGEMLPAHGYPRLRKHPHLAGNYGGAWQEQRKEFNQFPGAILMTTNCIQRPQEGYRSRIFTTGLVAWPGVTHVTRKNFGPVIRAAQAAEGFAADGPEQTITVGFGHQAVLGVATKVVDAVRQGQIRHFFLIGGCDGAETGRDYYTRFAEAVPKDCVILTLACGKYRFNKLPFGEIGGIPRLLDIGQCNDAYSAIRIASALAQAFDTDVNGLPLSLVLSWYEQKAVAILLTLLHLGIRNIRLGPRLPAFVTPAALSVLSEKFNLMPIDTPEKDLAAILERR
jgi:hydroxylamine reductase